MDVGDLRRLPLFDGTSDALLQELFALGTEVSFVPGQEMFREGRPADFWWVLLEGRVDLLRHVGREEALLGSMDVPGRWAGGFRAWDEHGAYLATGRAVTAGRFFCVPAGALADWATTWFPLGVHLIEGLFRTARSFESTTRQKEALAALGTLAAGLAHQLNNPAAAPPATHRPPRAAPAPGRRPARGRARRRGGVFSSPPPPPPPRRGSPPRS